MGWKLRSILLGAGVIVLAISLACNYPTRSRDPGDLPPVSDPGLSATGYPSGSEGETSESLAPEEVLEPGPGVEPGITGPSTRLNPAPTYERYSLPGWEIQVLQVLRGAQAWAFVQADNPEHPVPPAGYEYLLVEVELKCLHFETDCPSLGLIEMFATGDAGVMHTDNIQDGPGHEFYYADIYAAETVQGWADFLVPVEESNLELVFGFDYETEEFPAFSHYIALEQGASIPAYSPAGRPANPIGMTIEAPAPFGETVQTPDWQVTLLESSRGEAVEAFYADHRVKYRRPPDGFEYILLRALVRYYGADPGEQMAYLDIEDTVGLDRQGGRYDQRVYNYIPRPSNYTFYYPGGWQEGWLLIAVTEGEPNPVLMFTSGVETRYLEAQP